MQGPVQGGWPSTGVDSGPAGSTGFRLDSGIRGASTLRGRPGVWINEGFRVHPVDSDRGGLPKKSPW